MGKRRADRTGSEDSKTRADRIHELIDRSKPGRTPAAPPPGEDSRPANPRDAIHRRMRELDADTSEEVPDSDHPPAPSDDSSPPP